VKALAGLIGAGEGGEKRPHLPVVPGGEEPRLVLRSQRLNHDDRPLHPGSQVRPSRHRDAVCRAPPRRGPCLRTRAQHRELARALDSERRSKRDRRAVWGVYLRPRPHRPRRPRMGASVA
jgi:hypothetical protein